VTIDDLNALDRDAFIAAVGPTFERAPWVAEGAWLSRPFADSAALHRTLFSVVAAAPVERRLAFLNGHPDLAGHEARAGTMTDESVGEQASAGLGALTRDELAAFDAMNRAYRVRHGFPFIIAARLYDKAAILQAMRVRVARDTTTEADEAMRQIGIITRFRVDALVPSTTSTIAKEPS
jgi:2-oxo-4-hydroxy-4-carboxy-5-ureidoimidazoline decarboxylase